MPGSYLPGGLDPVHVGHGQVHEHEVGLVLIGGRHRLGPVCGGRDDLHVVGAGEQLQQAAAHHGVVVGDHHPDHWTGTSRTSRVPAPGWD